MIASEQATLDAIAQADEPERHREEQKGEADVREIHGRAVL